MRELNLPADKSQYVQAYGALQALSGAGSSNATITIEADGKTQTIQATPEIVQAFQRGLSTSVLGKQDALDVSFDDRNAVAQSLGVSVDQLDDLKSQQGSRFTGQDIMPWLHERSGAGKT
ncbi:hypothetical protein CcrC1_gp129c [Caulobacter phage C1]|nr:hypothetical protein CcrC1_gp129c [Caulobacter phage C1]UTU08358.1 hypothetical protein CcrC2_gp130c [Caulobacter phage C2]UTU08875.1 hypothetical protein CcrJ4_gp124c [Caulobacter phage J4]UTU09431.1 hypothetical protein CcrBL47_gp145c [Caulobacter phage BL47]UTU09991.1 hypothetical protein CcrRB23_gp129c [Caulobacter phage RB23]WGN97016.1 hypothetical protein [Bertelyvirus sp.]